MNHVQFHKFIINSTVVALLAALIVAATIIPQLDNQNSNDVGTGTGADSSNSNGNNNGNNYDATISPTTSSPTTEPTTMQPSMDPTTSQPTTDEPTTSLPTSSDPTTAEPTTDSPTTATPTGSPTDYPPNANITEIYYPYTCECNRTTYGIINAGESYDVGGSYVGWYWNPAYPDLYPFADVHAAVGDKLVFKSTQGWTPDNVYFPLLLHCFMIIYK